MREYEIEFPVHISYFQTTFIPATMRTMGIWKNIPQELKEKIEQATWDGVDFTQEDADSIDDETWDKIVGYFG